MNASHRDSLLRWGVRVVVPPVAEPISLAEAKLHLRVDDDGDSPPAHPDDPIILVLISAAREWCESYTGRALAPQTVELGGNAFALPSWQSCCARFSSDGAVVTYGAFIELPMGPVSSVLNVTYIDADGVPQTIAGADYLLDDFTQPPRVYAAQGVAWPTPQNIPNAARIRYVAGYDLPGDSPNPNPLPASIIAAMKLVLGTLYENREDTAFLTSSDSLQLLPMGAKALLDPYRLNVGLA